jgi:hypothetical protein
MPGILKIGMTERTPEARLREANSSDTWRPPTPYTIEFAKKVCNAKAKEKTLHILLEQYTDRINPRREFFRVSPEEVRTFFDLMDGEMWAETRTDDTDEEDEEVYAEPREEVAEEAPRASEPTGRAKISRDMTKCFSHGQRIRHTIGINKTWIGTYDSSKNAIIYDGKTYNSLSMFAKSHNKIEIPSRLSNTANGWRECECEVDGVWVSTNSFSG